MQIEATRHDRLMALRAARRAAVSTRAAGRQRGGIAAWPGVACWVLMGLAAGLAAAPLPLARAHAHNDYEHERPLLDALAAGFCSVEADIHLVEGRLLVAHDPDQVKAGRTLEVLYLDPLLARVRAQGGRVYEGGPSFTLLVDIKSEAEPTYAALERVLAHYEEMLTQFEDQRTEERGVTVILSGNRPRARVAGQARRWVGIDGRLSDVTTPASKHLIPLISDNWGTHFQWRGEGSLPEADRSKLEQIVSTAHARGQRVRFWATPDRPRVWRVLRDAGVDLLNTDDLTGLAAFLSAEE